MKDLYARVIEQVQATHHTRLDDSEDRATHSEAEDIIRGWDTIELLYQISSALDDMLQDRMS
jgi:hypothetical protein